METTFDHSERFVVREQRPDMELFGRAYEYSPALGSTPMDKALATMGFESMRKGQDDAVHLLLMGQDLLCIFPTGFGKTATFVLPALCHNWKTLVFSPLISLQKDQVDGLVKKGIPAGLINSHQSEAANLRLLDRWKNGDLLLLYVSPERLSNPAFMEIMLRTPPDFVVVDEAHCLSDWGDSFRADYVVTGEFIARVNPRAVGAFTATCGPEEVGDIRRVLGLGRARTYFYMPRRSNLELRSEFYISDMALVSHAMSRKGSTIVYSGSQKGTEEVARVFDDMLPRTEFCSFYHGGCTGSHRDHVQGAFMKGDIKYICATNAFGMGIDKPDIRTVIHREAPKAMSNLMQEMGRAGRDGLPSLCLTYDNPKAKNLARFFLAAENPEPHEIEKVFKFIKASADSEGQVRMTMRQIAYRLKIKDAVVASIMEILRGAKVLGREFDAEKLAMVDVRVSAEEVVGDANYRAFTNAVRLHGEKTDEGYIVNLEHVADSIGVSLATTKKRVKDYTACGRFGFRPPFAGKTTSVIGHLGLVDFERLARKRVLATKKLQAVEFYLATPDDRKHSYLENYFKYEEPGL